MNSEDKKKIAEALSEEMKKKDFAEIKKPAFEKGGKMMGNADYMDIIDTMSRRPLPPMEKDI